MKLKVLILFALALCTSQISFAQETPSVSRGYLLGPGDVVSITVYGEEQLNVKAATVDEDGKIQIPLFEQGMVAKCRTEKELTADVRQLLTKYLKNPQVSVRVEQRNSRPPATIFGEVRQQQRIDLMRKATLRDVLAFSGGVTEKASGMIQITRTQPVMCSDGTDDDWKSLSGNGVSLPSRIYSLGSLRETNPTIYPGDIIDVQKAAPIYVIGEVMRSGELLIPEGGLPLMQAIAMSSGPTRDAKKKEIKIYRRKQGLTQPEVILVNYAAITKGEQKDMILEPYDIIEVGKSKKSVFDVMLEIATGSVRNVANSAIMF
jgi:polysaccharide biosynthesis/export protein